MNNSTPNPTPPESNENNEDNGLHVYRREDGPIQPEHRREKLLAFHLDALDGIAEAELIRGRLDADADWQLASDEAKLMLEGFARDGLEDPAMPVNLGERTVHQLMQDTELVEVLPVKGEVVTENAGLPVASKSVDAASSSSQPERSVPKSLPGKAKAKTKAKEPRPLGISKTPLVFSRNLVAAILMLALLPGLWVGNQYWSGGPTSEAIQWKAGGKLAAGGAFAPDLIVRDVVTMQPVEGVVLTGFLSVLPGTSESHPGPRDEEQVGTQLSSSSNSIGPRLSIGEARTDASGMVVGDAWSIPDDIKGAYRLELEARSSNGKLLDRVQRDVQVMRPIKLAIAPDRPQARPGESIRARILCVSQASRQPQRNRAVTIDLLDPRGNRIGHVETRTTEFGLAWAEFPLDTQAPEGQYQLAAESEGLKTQRNVLVQQYRLPPFKIEIALNRPWFGPRDLVAGRIKAATFDGHPLPASKGTLHVRDESGRALFSQEITLNDHAQHAFSISAANLRLSAENNESKHMRISVELTDPAGRSTEQEKKFVVSSYPVLISAVPEAGTLVQGVKNRVYLVALTPDGKPAKDFTLKVSVPGSGANNSVTKTLKTDKRGIALLELNSARSPAEVITIRLGSQKLNRLMPQRVSLPVRQATGSGEATLYGRLLIRTDRAAYQAGEALNVQAFSRGRAGLVRLSLRQAGSTMATGSLNLVSAKSSEAPNGGLSSEGKSSFKLPGNASGLFVLEASIQLADGMVWRDRRYVVVSGGGGLRVTTQSNQGSKPFAPGDLAKLTFHVTNKDGAGVPAAVSVVGVDEALLAMSSDHPGLAQALQAEGFGVMGPTGGSFNYQDIKAEDGEEEGAFAKLASLQGNAKSDAEIFQTIDTRNAKVAAIRAHGRKTSKALGLWGYVLAGILLMAGILFRASGSTVKTPSSIWSLRYVENSVPMVTFGILGISIVSIINHGLQTSSVVITGLAIAGTLTHRILFGHGMSFMSKKEYARYFVANGLCDAVLVALTLSLVYAWPPNFLIGSLFCAMVLTSCVLGVAPVYRQLFIAPAFGMRGIGLVSLLFFGMLMVPFIASFRFRAYSPLMREGGEMPSVAGNQEMPKDLEKSIAVTPQSRRAYNILRSSLMAKDEVQSNASGRYFTWFPATPKNPVSLPRLRRDFRETLIFAPEIITDSQGNATLDVPLADSLTTWRVQTDAIGKNGGTAWTDTLLMVTQPFSIDLTLPTSVTVGDVLHVPAVVSNHQNLKLNVTLEIDAEGVEVESPKLLTLDIGARSVAALPFTLRFTKAGSVRIRVLATAAGERGIDPNKLDPTGAMSDAVERSLLVRPSGRPMGFAASTMIVGNGDLLVSLPAGALPGTIQARLSLHRGPVSQMIQGLESMLREPHGCFEQTSSTNYPNIMIMRYLKSHGVNNPALESRTRDYLARGYQRLLGFEVGRRSGGFSMYGRGSAIPWLTAYGLMQFQDMASVYPVDPALLERIRTWLIGSMARDGSFNVRSSMGLNSKLAGTAYVVWALGDRSPAQSIRYLQQNWRVAERDPYLSALVAVALVNHDRAVAGQLAISLKSHSRAEDAPGGQRASLSTHRTLAWGRGRGAEVQTTSLAVLALLNTGQDAALATRLLNSLQEKVAPGGGWGSTHATVLALKALERSAGDPRGGKAARVVVTLNGRALDPITIPEQEEGAAVSIPLNLPPGKSTLNISIDQGTVVATVTGEAFIPWGAEGDLVQNASMTARVRYSATELTKGQTVLGTLELGGRQTPAEVPMVEWGMPAGFSPLSEDLEILKKNGSIKHWERLGRSLRLYLPDVAQGKKATLGVRFRAHSKGILQAAPGRVYEYYRKEQAAPLASVRFVVK